MGPLGFHNLILIPFLFEFTRTIVVPVIPVVAAIVAPLLEFLIIAFATVIIEILTISLPGLVGPEALHVRCVGEFQLTCSEIGQFALDRVVVDSFFMPVVIRQLHIVGDRIGKAIAFFRIFFGQRLVYDDLQVLAQVGELGIAFGIFQRFGAGPQCFPGGDGVRRGYFQLEVGDQEKVIP